MGERRNSDDFARREFLKRALMAGGGLAASNVLSVDLTAVEREGAQPPAPADTGSLPDTIPVALIVNGQRHALQVDPQTTVLDAIRDRLGLTGTKKGCDRGQCGACTVLAGGHRINSCLALAASYDETPIITVEGLAANGELHPLQQAFLDHDAFQCGFCTSGQLMSAAGLMTEGCPPGMSLQECMSGNICRCGAYNGIFAAIEQVQARKPATPTATSEG